MRCPPYVVSMRVRENEQTKFRFWFPLFILWPLLLALVLLTLVATLLADLFTLISGRRPGYTRFALRVLGVVSETSGTEVMIRDREHFNRTVAFTLR